MPRSHGRSNHFLLFLISGSFPLLIKPNRSMMFLNHLWTLLRLTSLSVQLTQDVRVNVFSDISILFPAAVSPSSGFGFLRLKMMIYVRDSGIWKMTAITTGFSIQDMHVLRLTGLWAWILHAFFQLFTAVFFLSDVFRLLPLTW